MTEKRTVFVVSDSTGETADRAVQASLRQFPGHKVDERIFTRVRDKAAISGILDEAKRASALVVFTLVDPDQRAHLHHEAETKKVEVADVIGSLIHKIGLYLTADPLNAPTNVLPLSEEYFRRVDALEFAVRSDDGKEPGNLWKADLVLTGVSRTSKTPLSTYLAGRGLKVANVPLLPGVTPPQELFEVPANKVVVLTISEESLVRIRKARLSDLGMPDALANRAEEQVKHEIAYAKSVLEDHPGWLTVDVTDRAIEETATIILEALSARAQSRKI